MAAAENASAAADGILDEVYHALYMLRANHGANVGGGVTAGAKPQLFRFRHAARGKFITYGSLNEKTLDGEADLAAIGVTAPNRGAGGNVEVGVGEDEHSVFAAEFKDGRDQALGAGFGDTPPGGDASGEQNFVRIGFNQRLAHFRAALHNGNYILREAGVGEELLDQRATVGSEIACLANHGI